jgi:hypothetical protein
MPGTEAARKLAACSNAAEHHLSPDLKQEIIVLRNRRNSKDFEFAFLKEAFNVFKA